MTSAPAPVRWPRRTFLLAGGATLAAGVTGLGACGAAGGSTTPQSSVSGGAEQGSAAGQAGPGDPPTPTQPPAPSLPGALEGAAVEQALAAQAGVVLATGSEDLGKAGRALVTAIRSQHAAHADALRTSDPTDPNAATDPAGASTPTPADTPTEAPSLTKALDRLLEAQTSAAATHRARALRSEGTGALLWGSLAISAGSLAAVLEAADLAGDDPNAKGASVAAIRSRAPMPVLAPVAADQEMVRQLHAVVYGYQLALGRLSGSRRDTAAAELKRHRILRDRLTARLTAADAEVPVAEAAYVPSTNPRNAATAAKLIRQLETALMPFCGVWLAAAATSAQRSEALGQLGRTLGVARHWGAALPAWPGWG